MKSLFFSLIASITVANAYDLSKEQAPAGALEKIAAAVPQDAYAKPPKNVNFLSYLEQTVFGIPPFPREKLHSASLVPKREPLKR